MTAAATWRRPRMDDQERQRRDAYERVRASFRLEGQQLRPDEERELEAYFRGEVTLDELTSRAIARFTAAAKTPAGSSET